ncbi:hypothetical protein AB0C02_28195 [Micromonospora sp. NPDC048999]|uniref:hypothetical protein n=1 Tax=Micromonospora sp. NPDC048999 TaxID=3155391 RepID=UPI0033EE1DB1
MDPAVLSALIGAGGVIVGGLVTGPAVAKVLGRRMEEAQRLQVQSQAEQVRAQTEAIRQGIYEQLTTDLRSEIDRLKTELADARQSLRITSDEAERLRARVLELESRVAELTTVQAERDRLRSDVAARDATIHELQRQVGDLKAQLASAMATPAS